ncbi:MAG: T9SS C-terminal target domain-containing protein, partial [Candidatus Latescibacterota bacterium]
VTWNDGLVDLALVWRTFYARELVSFASDLLGGSLERFAPTIGADFLGLGLQPIPGAIYLPFQIELILYPFSRTPYIIYVEDQTTTDISAVYSRIPVQTIIDELGSPKPDFLALIRALDVRKYAIEEGIEVDGPGEQDLTLDIAEGAPVLVRVANTIPGLNVFSVALADLDGLSGGGRLMPCGFGGAAGGTDTLLALSTLGSGAPGSPDYLAGALQSDTVDGTANTGVFVRTGLTAGDTADATQYLAVPVAALQSDVFTWTPTANAPAGLFPDVQRAGITLVTTIPDTNAWAEPGDTLDIPTPLWNFYLGGADTSFVLPCLGPDFPSPLVDPTTTPDQDRLDWGITAIRLGLDPSFDYDDWDLVDLGLSGTHIAGEQERFVPLPGTPYTAVAAAPAPGAGRLGAPSPNPFRVETRVRFAVPAREESARLAVYDIAGRRVRSLASGGAGREATWDGRDESGRVVPSGIYLFRLEAGGEVLTRKVVKTR